jgi:DNA-binding transcriptional regulator YdaS (Cro superfamily)
MNIKPLITLLGGPAKIARYLQICPQAVSIWIAKGRIPVGRVPSLERLARQQGVEVRAEHMRADIDWAVLRQGSNDPSAPSVLSNLSNLSNP